MADMSATVLSIALAHAAAVLLAAAVTRSRGWTIVAAVLAVVVAMRFGDARDTAEELVAIGLAFWACWRMLPRTRPRPRRTFRSRSGSGPWFRAGDPVIVGGICAVFLVVTVASLNVSRAGARITATPAGAVDKAGPQAALKRKTADAVGVPEEAGSGQAR